MNYSPTTLAAWAETHDGVTALVMGDSLRMESDVVLSDGTVEREMTLIPATLKAVRNYLGY